MDLVADEVLAEAVLVVIEVDLSDLRCIAQSVISVERTVKFLSDQMGADQFTAVNVLKLKTVVRLIEVGDKIFEMIEEKIEPRFAGLREMADQ